MEFREIRHSRVDKANNLIYFHQLQQIGIIYGTVAKHLYPFGKGSKLILHDVLNFWFLDFLNHQLLIVIGLYLFLYNPHYKNYMVH